MFLSGQNLNEANTKKIFIKKFSFWPLLPMASRWPLYRQTDRRTHPLILGQHLLHLSDFAPPFLPTPVPQNSPRELLNEVKGWWLSLGCRRSWDAALTPPPRVTSQRYITTIFARLRRRRTIIFRRFVPVFFSSGVRHLGDGRPTVDRSLRGAQAQRIHQV